MNGHFGRPLRWLAPPVAVVFGLITIWELVAQIARVPEWLLPAPTTIAAALSEAIPLLVPHVVRTLSEAVIGYGLALAAALLLSIAIDHWEGVRRSIYPLLVTTQTIPIFALAPLLAIWFGFGILPKVIVVALVCFFPIVVNVSTGLHGADVEMQNLVRTMGGGRRQIFMKVKLPAAIPSLLAGMKIAATYSVIGAVIAEWLGASQGLGLYLLRSANSFKTDHVFAAIAVITALSIGMFIAVDILGRIIAPWIYVQEEDPG